MIEVKLGNTGVQALVDTGAKLSCISEQLLQCHELFKFCKIRKCDKRAYGVNGEPVVTLGIVEVSFKINNFSFTHEFTILRGLIHPMLLGFDLLVHFKAKIDVGDSPSINLFHPIGGWLSAPFLRAAPKNKPAPHVALVKGVTLPPMAFFYVNAYIANVDCVETEIGAKNGLMGITSIQKVDDFFDPGFMLRDAVVSTKSPVFRVELANPFELPLKLADDTPLGVVFDYDCEVIETNGAEESLWENKPNDASEQLMREQALLNSSIAMVETQLPDTISSGVGSEWKAKPPDRSANLLGRQSAHQQTGGAAGGDLLGTHPIQHPIHSLDDSLPQPQPWLPG